MLKPILAVLLISLSLIGCSSPSQSNQNAPVPNAQAAENRDAEGNTPLLKAVNEGNTAEVRRLIEAGANVNAASTSGVTPLMNAAGMGNKEAVELLIQKGADVNYRTSGNYTVLMAAALVGKTEIVKILLDAGADPTVKDIAGRTALSYAEDKKNDEVIRAIRQKMPPQNAGKN